MKQRTTGFKNLSENILLAGVLVFLTLVIFLVDILIPLGVAGGVLYVLVVLGASWWPTRTGLIIVASGCSLLTVAGYFLSPQGGELWKVFANRSLALVVIFATSFLILQRKNSEKQLEKSEAQHRLVTNNLPACIAYLDTKERFVMANQRHEEWFGISPSQIVGQHVRDVFGEPGYQAVASSLEEAFSGQITSVNVQLFKGSERSRWIEATYVPSWGEKGVVQGVCSLILDITERTEAQEALGRRELEHAIIANLGRLALSGLGISVLMQSVTDMVSKVLKTSHIDIWEISSNGECFTLMAEKGFSTQGIGEVRVDNTIHTLPGYLRVLGEPMAIDDFTTETRIQETQWWGEHGLMSGLITPIQGRDHTIGVLGTYSIEPVIFMEQDLKFLHAVGNVLGVAIERQRAEETFRLVVESAPSGMLLADAEGRITLVNSLTESLFGYSREELLGEPVERLIPERYRSQHPTSRGHYMKSPTVRSMGVGWDLSGLRKDGTEFPIEIGLTPLKTSEGLRVLSSIVDITERKLVEEALQGSEDRLKKAQQIAQVGSWELDVVKNHLWWSDEVYRIFGMDPQESSASYEAFLNTVHPDDREWVDNAYTESVKTKNPYDIVHRLCMPGGWIKFVNERCETFYDDDGNPMRSVGTVQDITERTRNQQRLHIREKEQVALATLGQWALGTESLTTLLDQAVILVAQTLAVEYCKVLELAPDGLTCLLRAGTGWQEGLVGTARVGTGMDSQAGHTLQSETPVIVKDLREETRFSGPLLLQEHGVVSGMSVVIPGKTSPFGVLGVHTTHRQDYSEDDIVFVQAVANILADAILLKQSEQIQSDLLQELERKNLELEQFALTVSHDLKSPLVTIRGYLKYVEKGLDEGNIALAREDIAKIRTATEIMGHRLEDVLALSKIGKVVREPTRVSFAELVDEVRHLLRGSFEEHGIQVEEVTDFPIVFGDRSRLVEMLQNLFDNAVKFMGDQPQPRIEVGVRQDGEEQVFFVRDNGIGIAPQYQEKVFGLFNRLSTETEGSGIGLTVVLRIIEAHRGRIWIESEGSGRGTTFCFVLPQGESQEL